MFDIGFWELALVGLVALLVLGPERLPAFARTVGRWVGKAQRLTREFKRDLEREIDLSELRQLKQDLQTPELSALAQDLQKSTDEINRDLNQPLVFGPTTPAAATPPVAADPTATTATAAPPTVANDGAR